MTTLRSNEGRQIRAGNVKPGMEIANGPYWHTVDSVESVSDDGSGVPSLKIVCDDDQISFFYRNRERVRVRIPS